MQCDKAFRRNGRYAADIHQNHTMARIAKRIGGPSTTRIRVENAAVGSGARHAGQRKACRRTVAAHSLQTSLATSSDLTV
jgi:hypothetical protein